MEQRAGAGEYRQSGASWAKGAAVLGIAAIVSKLLGTLQKIPLQNIAGDGAYGIYTIVYPFYILILFMATAGFPIAISVFVAERLTRGDHAGARRVLEVSTVLLLLSGSAAFAAMYFGADRIADWIGNSQTAPAIRSVSWALLFIPVMSALRGYYQGQGNMLPTAVSQVVEQFVRVGTMLLLLLLLTAQQAADRVIAAGATFGAVTGACAGMLLMLIYWQRDKTSRRAAPHTNLQPAESRMRLAGKLARYAIPVCLGAIALPVMHIVDSFTLPRLFQQDGMSEEQVLGLLGVYARGQPLVQLVAMLISAMAAALVPAIAEAMASKDNRALQTRASVSIRITWVFGAAASAGLAAMAAPINWMLYKDDQGTSVMMILAFTAVFSMLNIISASVLQGMGHVRIPAVNMLGAAVVKLGLNFVLTPIMGMEGAALAGVIAFALAAAANLLAIARLADVKLRIFAYLPKTLLALVLMIAVVRFSNWGLAEVLTDVIPGRRMMNTIIAMLGITGGALVFGLAAVKLRVIGAEELRLIPGGSSRIVPMLQKLRFIRDA